MGKETKRILFQIVLFIATLITTTLAGAEWVYGRYTFMDDYTWSDFTSGFAFSIPFLLILTVHEFGHYFTAMYHKVKASLPYYIPIPFSIGTLGAVIRLRSRPYSNVQNFDIGLAGPLAGFIVAVALLIYGYATLPPAEYVFQFHPEYKEFGLKYAEHVYNPEFLQENKIAGDVVIGKSLIFLIAEQFVSDPSRIPNPHELMHYPLLFAVYLALFFTSLNLLPIGQFDGGHVVYGLFGFRKHRIIASIFFVALMFYGGLGNPYVHLGLPKIQLLSFTALYILFVFFAFGGLGLPRRDTIMFTLVIVALQFLFMLLVPEVHGYFGWLILGFILGRFIGVPHPRSEVELPLDSKRIILGWVMLLIFILCFHPVPIDLKVFTE